MESLPPNSSHSKHNQSYVYTLAYPVGTVFYVGKGTGKRIYSHEVLARRKRIPSAENLFKIHTIRRIWADGEEVVKNVLAYFSTDEEAYLYETALNIPHAQLS